jgi:hypothetical protein
MFGMLKPFWHTLIWLVVGIGLVLVLDQIIPRNFRWPIYRWALGGLGVGLFCGSYSAMLELAQAGPKVEESWRGRSDQKKILGIALLFVFPIVLIPWKRAGLVLAGTTGGALGGFVIAMIVAGFNDEVERAFGYWNVARMGAALCGLGGAVGGLLAPMNLLRAITGSASDG